MTTSKVPASAPAAHTVDRSRIWWPAGVIAIVSAVVVNLIALFVVRAVVPGLSPEFPPLQPFPIVMFTTLGVGLGVVVFWFLARRNDSPYRLWDIIAWAALILSIVPNILSAINPSSFPFPGATSTAFWILIVFHLIAGGIAIWVMNNMTRRR